MPRHFIRTPRRLVPLALSLIVSALPQVVSAQEIVTITDVTFERHGALSDVGTPSVAVWITCDGSGIIGDLSVTIEQRGVVGTTNSLLQDAACTTEPTRYRLSFDVFDGEFRPGKALIIQAETLPDRVEFGADQRIILRKGSLLGT